MRSYIGLWVAAIFAFFVPGAISQALAQTPVGTVIANRATATYADFGGAALAAQSKTVETPVAGKARLTVGIAPNRMPAAPGDTVLLAIDVSNPGNLIATGVTLNSRALDNLVRILAADAGGRIVGQQVGWNAPFDLAPGAHLIRQVQVRVNDTAVAGSGFRFQATAGAANVTESAQATAQVPVDVASNAALAKRPDRAAVRPGGTITYTLTYANLGNATARQARLTDHLPPEVSYVSATPQPSRSASVLTWNLGDLAWGRSGSISLTVRIRPGVASGTQIRNTTAFLATVAKPTGLSVAYTSESPPSVVTVESLRLALSKTAETARDTLTIGDSLVYRLVLANIGGQEVSRVTLRDTLAAVLDLESVQANVPVQTSGRVVEATWAPFPAGGVDTLRIFSRVRALEPMPAWVSNRAWAVLPDGSQSSPLVQTPLRGLRFTDGRILQPATIFAGQVLKITLLDADFNRSGTAVDTVRVTTVNVRTGERERPLLYETGPNTGEFSGEISTGFGTDAGEDGDGRLIAQHQDRLRSVYTDPQTTSGIPVERSAETVVLPTRIVLRPDPETIVANGTDRSLLTARVMDEDGNPLPDGTPVRFTADKGTFEGGGGQITVPVSGGNGEAVTLLIAPVLARRDTAHVLASFEGFDSDVVNLEVMPGAVGIRVYDEERGVEITGADPNIHVDVRLTGNTVTGDPVSIGVTVDEKGLFVVPEIPPGTYRLQALVREISTGRVISKGALQQITINFDGSATPPQNAISGMLRGRREKSGARYAGGQVELLDALGMSVATTVLDEDGRYDFQGLQPGLYTIRVTFADGTVFSRAVSSRSQRAGEILVNTNILIDPFGTTFDAATGAPVAGVTVTLLGTSGGVLPIPHLSATGAVPNADNSNPFVTTDQGRYAFLFGGDQVGSVDNPVTHVMTLTPPAGTPYLPRRLYLAVRPSQAGPVDQVPITMQVSSADGLDLALPNSTTLTSEDVVVPDIQTIAFNIPLFTRAPVIVLAKHALQDTVAPGESVDFQLAVSNTGNDTARSVTVMDTLGEGWRLLRAQDGEVLATNVVRWHLGVLLPGQQDTLALSAEVTSPQSDGAVLVNRASAGRARGLPVHAEARVVVRAGPVWALDKVVGADSVAIGQVFDYIFWYQNIGTGRGAGAALVDSLPPVLTVVSAPDAIVDGQVVRWDLGEMPAGGRDSLQLTVQIAEDQQAGEAILNRAHILNAEEQVVATAQARVGVRRRIRRVLLVKTAEPAVVQPGQEVRYRIAVSSTFEAIGEIAVRDTLPAELAYVIGSSRPVAQYDSLSHALTWTLADVAVDRPQMIEFRALPRAGLAPGEHEARNVALAVADSTEFASDPADVVITVPFFSVQKSADRTVAETGDLVVYRVTVQNLSPNDTLRQVRIQDRMPYGFGYVEGSAYLNGRRFDPDSLKIRDIVWRLSGLDAGQLQALSYRLVVGAGAETGDGTNVATASAIAPSGYPLTAGPARASVRIRPDFFARGEVIIGRAWVDRNGNGICDEGEPPVSGVALMMEDGTRVVADRQGRFSVPEVTAGDHVLRLLRRNVPPGLEPVPLGVRSSSDPWIRFVTVPQGGMAKANFPFREVQQPTAGADSLRTQRPGKEGGR